MEDPNTTAAPSAVDPTSTPAAAPAVEVQQPASTPATPVEAVPAGVDRSDKASLRRAEREAGRRKLTEKLDREARQMGYANHAELLASVRAQKADAAAKPADSATPAAPAAVEELAVWLPFRTTSARLRSRLRSINERCVFSARRWRCATSATSTGYAMSSSL